eukprot:5020920-Pleurochrysis_carterae.AAC.1
MALIASTRSTLRPWPRALASPIPPVYRRGACMLVVVDGKDIQNIVDALKRAGYNEASECYICKVNVSTIISGHRKLWIGEQNVTSISNFVKNVLPREPPILTIWLLGPPMAMPLNGNVIRSNFVKYAYNIHVLIRSILEKWQGLRPQGNKLLKWGNDSTAINNKIFEGGVTQCCTFKPFVQLRSRNASPVLQSGFTR